MVRTRTNRPSCSVYVASSSWCMLFHGHDVAAMDKTATHGDPSHSSYRKIPRVASRISWIYATSMAVSLIPWRKTPSPPRNQDNTPECPNISSMAMRTQQGHRKRNRDDKEAKRQRRNSAGGWAASKGVNLG